MEYVYLGRTGLKVSELCLGAMTLGKEADEETSRRILDLFTEAGGNFIDTANVYSQGGSEEVLGRWMKRHGCRDDLVIATKVRFVTGSGPNDAGLSRKHIVGQVQASLRRLDTEYVDLLQVHAWDPGTPLEETLDTLDRLVGQGLVRYVGASNFAGWQLERALMLAERHGWEAFCSLQPQYNLLTRSPEWELLPVCRLHGLAVIPWGPLAGGWLTGKHTRDGGAVPGTRVAGAGPMNSEFWDKRATEHTWSVLDVVRDIASARGVTMSQVALNWLRAQPAVTAPIVGARTPAHLEENLSCLSWTLSDAEVQRLTEASAVDLVYPYDFLFRRTADRQRPQGRVM